MYQNAEARARAANSLDEAARAIKRAQTTLRNTLQIVRQSQAEMIGIEVETITQPGGTGESSSNSSTASQQDQ